MNIRLICIGKTDDSRIESLFIEYEKRLKHYINFKSEFLVLKKKSKVLNQTKIEEGELILQKIDNSSFLVLLDEQGKSFDSIKFSGFLQKRMNSGIKELVFLIGGAHGFSSAVYDRANAKVALSSMTFTHQMVRILFIEQLYRAFTILRGEKYHH
ncbi:MAG: 23S rRNA (pseudouridine(1915)-N(3))-methyltransferase RlmH [Vicingaceae bacterium]